MTGLSLYLPAADLALAAALLAAAVLGAVAMLVALGLYLCWLNRVWPWEVAAMWKS